MGVVGTWKMGECGLHLEDGWVWFVIGRWVGVVCNWKMGGWGL